MCSADLWYARNDAKGLTPLVSRNRITGKACATSETALSLPTSSVTRGDVLSDTGIVYDNATATGWDPNQSPTLGLPTWTGRAKAYPALATGDERHPTAWQTVTKSTYDTNAAKLGRLLSVADAAGNTTSTVYTPANTGPLARTTVTNPKGHKTNSYLDPVRGSVLRHYDVNSKKTETTYDALGRITAIWAPDRVKAADTAASVTYDYSVTEVPRQFRTAPQVGRAGHPAPYGPQDGQAGPRDRPPDHRPVFGRGTTQVARTVREEPLGHRKQDPPCQGRDLP